jgi:hypothetical protein
MISDPNGKKLVAFLDENFDVLFGVFLFLAASVVLYITYSRGSFSTAEMAASAVITCSIYFLFRDRIIHPKNVIESDVRKKKLYWCLIAFSLLYTVSILILHFSEYRPFMYFLVITVLTLIVLLEFYYTGPATIATESLLLVQIVIIAINLRFSGWYEYAGMTGADGWIHLAIVNDILRSGRILFDVSNTLGTNGYFNYPFFHLIIASANLITSLGMKESFVITIGTMNVVSIVFIYLFAREIAGTGIARYAALFICIFPIYVVWGKYLIPTSLGISFFIILLFLVFWKKQDQKYLIILLITAIIFTHIVSAFVTLIVLAALISFKEIYRRLKLKDGWDINLSLPLVLFFAGVLGIKWMYDQYYPSTTFFEFTTATFYDSLRTSTNFVGDLVYTPGASPLNRLWFTMTIAFFVMGMLFYLNRKNRQPDQLILLVSCLPLALSIAGFSALNLQNILPSRWVGFIIALGIPVIVQGIISFTRIFSVNSLQKYSMMGIMFIFILFSLNNNSINLQSPFYNTTARTEFTNPEIQAISTFSVISPNGIITDYDYAFYPIRFSTKIKDIQQLRIDSEIYNFMVVRDYLYTHKDLLYYQPAVRAVFQADKRADIFLQSLKSSHYDLVYSNGGVSGYVYT